ncbi:MAG TPA: hypothetical protein GXX17_02330 [Clostridiales bacterium]|nr:hypothetical protein [Clostridiales bacterium]
MKVLRLIAALLLVCAVLNLASCDMPEDIDSDSTSDNSIPVLSITLSGKNTIDHINIFDYIDGTYSLTGGRMNISDQKIRIKGRGNSTWTHPKKPYAIKLEQSTDLLGMGSAKNWVLLANYWDKTLLRNYLTLTLGRDMGLEFTPECRFVDLYINGEYRGNYLLTEKIEIGKNRVDLGNSGVLCEIDSRHNHFNDNYYDTPMKVHITFKEPGEDIISGTVKEYLINKIKDAEASLRRGYNEYSKHIDVDSFVNWYILNELVKNYDSKFVTSCYFYMDNAGIIHMGPIWDYDTCMGNQITGDRTENPVGWHVSQAPWYHELTYDKTFMEKVRQRWAQIRNEGIIDSIFTNIDQMSKYIEKSRIENFKVWPDAMMHTELRRRESKFTYEEEIAHLKNFLKRRISWMDGVLEYKKYKN